MKKGKVWLRDKVSELYPSYDEMYVSSDYETVTKTETISKILELIDQLEEPEKPVIPKFVADYIELNKGWSEDRQEYIEDDNSGLWFALDGNSYGMSNSVLDWLFNEEKVETFARAWLDGFTIANEDKQEVEENFYTFDNAKKWSNDNGFVVFEKDKLDEEIQRIVSETYEAMNEKPAIPQFVADWIEETKKQGKSLVFAITHIYYKNEIGKSPNKEENKIFQWMELAYNEEVFARAWIDGYKVEKEQKYHVVNKENYFMLRKYDGLVDILHVSPSMSRDEYGKDTIFMLTEKEIKDYDERFWAFAEEVTE